MNRVAEWIVDHSKSFFIFYGILIVLSIAGMGLVDIEYDLSSYLPQHMSSYQGKEILEEEFELGGMASLMIGVEEVENIGELIGEIQQIDGIKEVLYFPKNQKQGYDIIDLIFKEGSSSQRTQQAIEEIEALLQDIPHHLGGESAIAKDMQDTTEREVIKYSIVAFVVIAIILVLGSSTYIEPVYFFIAIGVAIILNMGSNVIFGTISSNTNSIASILQLAVSMDYSIFLLHRYNEEKLHKQPKEAMKEAIIQTFGSVSASALTTIGGFMALVFMKYGIGKDMGLVLAKGVLLSLICVMTVLPALILVIDCKIKSKTHKVWIPKFTKLAPFVIKGRIPILVIALLIAVPTLFAHTQVSYYYSNEKTLKDSAKSIAATKAIREVFGLSNQIIVITPLTVTDQLKDVMNEVKAVEGVDSVLGLYSIVGEKLPIELIPKEIVNKFQTEEYTYFAIQLLRPLEGEETSITLEAIDQVLQSQLNDQYYLTGESVIYNDLKAVTQEDFQKVTWISLLFVGIVLVATFKSISIPIILLFIIQLGIWINLSIPYFLGDELNFISFIILGAIQLGATVDYAILFTSKYKENLSTMTPYNAATDTIINTSSAVLTSALILIAGTLSVYMMTTIRSASELTMLIARGALISLVLVYILLPAMLLVFNKIIERTSYKWPKS